jgi:LmbE family N-acetylglucosaminyl deacetylase
MVRRGNLDDAPPVRSTDLPTPRSALAIVAHPDDAEFQCGGTLAKWARAGCAVHHLVLTDGSKGTWDPHVDQAALIHRRRLEQEEASRRLGGTSVTFLECIDGELAAGFDQRAAVSAVIRRLRPAVVLGHDPWTRYRLHPDHAAAGRLCVDGIVAARDPFFHPEQLSDDLTVHRPDALLLFEPDVPDHAESLSAEDLDAKVAALEAHESQFETTHLHHARAAGDDSGDRVAALQAFRDRERAIVEATGAWAGVPYAEHFHLIVDQL